MGKGLMCVIILNANVIMDLSVACENAHFSHHRVKTGFRDGLWWLKQLTSINN